VQVAALYDVHGNLPALEAVLAEVPDDAELVIGGDVAYGPYPSETLERLRALGDRVHWLRGNADRELTPGEDAGLTDGGNLEWVRARLSAEQIAFLYGLPPTLTLEIDGLGRVLFCHATPQNDLDIFTAITPEERVRPSFAEVTDDLVVVGHTHMQFDRSIAGLRVVNAGSIGMAYEESPDAYWTLLGPGVEHRHSAFEPDLGDYPGEWPSASRDEATSYFETLAVGS
jgi:predicted phosphodiesterase